MYIIKKQPPSVLAELKKHSVSDICISSITYAELRYGVSKSANRQKNALALAIFLTGIRIVPFDLDSSEVYGDIRQELQANGTPIGSMDMLIAAHAKALGYTLVTNNLREFNRVRGLKTENWV